MVEMTRRRTLKGSVVFCFTETICRAILNVVEDKTEHDNNTIQLLMRPTSQVNQSAG